MKTHGIGTQDEHVNPVAANEWADVLTARVITPGARPRVHGYDVERDLARNYRFQDLVLLSLTGEIPSEPASRAFDVALQFLAPVAVNEAPTHVASLLHILGSRTANLLAVGAITLSEQARHLLERHEPLLVWLAHPSGEFPHDFRAQNASDLDAVTALREALAGCDLAIPALTHGPTRDAALVSVLYACGLVTTETLMAALMLARLPLMAAEAYSSTTGNFGEYPMNLPRWRYEEPK